MSNDNPLRAVLMKTFYCHGIRFNKGEIYNISKISSTNGNAVVNLKFGLGAIAVMPSTILVLAPDPKPQKSKKKWPRKKKNVS